MTVTNISFTIINLVLSLSYLFVHIFCLWTFMDNLFNSEFYFPHFKNISFLQTVFLRRKRFYNNPKRFTYLRKLVDMEVVFFLSEFIFISELTYIDHNRWHDFWEFRIIGKKSLILISKLHDSYLFQHYIDHLSS